jgi:hypothetical protein
VPCGIPRSNAQARSPEPYVTVEGSFLPGPKRLIPDDGATGDQADSLGPPENSGRAAYLQPAGLADIKARHSRSYMELRPDRAR